MKCALNNQEIYGSVTYTHCIDLVTEQNCAIHIDIIKEGKQERSKWDCIGNGYCQRVLCNFVLSDLVIMR